MSNNHHLEELIDRHLRGELNESEMEQLAELLDSDSSARKDFVDLVQWDTRFAEVLRERRDDESLLGKSQVEQAPPSVITSRRRTWSITKLQLSVVSLVFLAMVTFLYIQRSNAEQHIVKISGLNGSLQWTGDGGRVMSKISLGTKLAGGTVEGMAPDSWLELTFNDGSVVSISGNSMLTFSDHDQKNLRLVKGNIAAKVVPQPDGRPMLIHTRTAVLEVIGTAFEVEADLASTVLNVSEGKVRIKRISDGSTVDVPANHRVNTDSDREMSAVRVPDSVNQWRSHLNSGPHHTYGRWIVGAKEEVAKLKTIPYITEQGKTIYAAAIGVSNCDTTPVVLEAGSEIRVRGRMATQHYVFFGITVRQASGEFAGRFQTIRPAEQFPGGQDFEVVLQLVDYHLDPSLEHMKSKLPDRPSDLVVESIWCHSLYDQVGLEVTSVELIPPAEQESEPDSLQ